MKSIEHTQNLWNEYLELCRECDQYKLEDSKTAKLRHSLMQQKIAVLRKIRGVE
jgi:hypothetical protein